MKPLLPLSTRLSDETHKTGIGRDIIEKDYVLSWVLAGISEIESLKKHLIFKGGTCLRKCYFGSYRFSEDLDFSAVGDFPKGKELEQLIAQAVQTAQTQLITLIGNVEIFSERYIERQPHPFNQEAFIVKFKLPYQREPLVRVLIEVTTQEKILSPTHERAIIHGYGEEMSARIQTYSLEEIIAEKCCAILSNTRKIHERTWVRSRARDYYDIWCIFKKYERDLALKDLPGLIKAKCDLRGQSYQDAQDFFEELYIKEVQRTWKEWLCPLVQDLPNSNEVIEDLRAVFEKHICN